MALLVSYDVETTGLDKSADRIIEVGLCLYSTTQRKILESTGFLVQSDGVKVTDEITQLTGITQVAVDKFGYDKQTALEITDDYFQAADYVIGHNVIRFDKPFTENTARRNQFMLTEKTWIDTMTDIPGLKGEQLVTMCAKHGFLNPNAHSAEDDAKAVLKLSSFYDIDKMVERAKSPLVAIQSHQDRNKNEDAKKFQFRWYPERKIWYKLVKEMDLKQLMLDAPFTINILDKPMLEELSNL